MKPYTLMCCIGLLTMLAMAEDRIIHHVEPLFVQIWDETAKSLMGQDKINVTCLLQLKEDCELWDYMDDLLVKGNPYLSSFNLTDSTGRDLGVPSVCYCHGEDGISFHFERYPSSGAEWLRLTGSLPVDLPKSDIITSEPVPVNLKKGEEAATGAIKIRIAGLEHNLQKYLHWEIHWDPEVDYSILVFKNKVNMEVIFPADYRLTGFIVTDVNGRAIVSHSSSEGYIGVTEHHSIIRKNLYLIDLPEQVNIAVQYRKVKTILYPLDVKFDLYLPAQESKK